MGICMEDMRYMIMERERRFFSPYAFLTENTRGREIPIEPSSIRTEYQRDRDRIVHSQSFRRLMHKTQVFLAPVGAHYRTRLTHTLEVSQIARTIARGLSLNEDLVEAIALGHDLGHTPFGHAGEEAMQECFSPDFTHYKQSLRVIEKIENNGAGLNLTWEVRDGIVNHTGKCMASTLEGVIVKYADRIAYINHDIDDACAAGILSAEDIPADLIKVLGKTHGQRIDTMVMSLVNASKDRPMITMTDEIQSATDKLRAFLFEAVYKNPIAKGEENKAKELLTQLFHYYVSHPEAMPDTYKTRLGTEDTVERCACDYVSCMTDRAAIEIYRKLFVPEVWRGR